MQPDVSLILRILRYKHQSALQREFHDSPSFGQEHRAINMQPAEKSWQTFNGIYTTNVLKLR